MTTVTPLSRVECQSLLAEHLPTLEACFKAAWDRWRKWLKELPGSPADVSPRSRASTLYDFITSEVAKQLSGKPGVQIKKSRGLLLVRFRDRVAIRFKKFRGKSLKTSSNHNGQTIAFEQHTLELPSASVQPVTHLVAGYLLDELAVDLEQIAITCSVDGEHFWAPIEVLKSEAVHTADVRIATTADPTAAKPSVRSASRKKNEGA
jgi:hypothetical protein